MFWESPGGPVVRTLCFTAEDTDSVPGWGIKILQAVWRRQKKKKVKNILQTWFSGNEGEKRKETEGKKQLCCLR